MDYPIIAPFYTDVDIRSAGQVSYIGGITELSRTGFSIKKPSFWGSFEKLRLGFELLMFYYIEPSSVFLKTKSKVLLKPGLESYVIPPYELQLNIIRLAYFLTLYIFFKIYFFAEFKRSLVLLRRALLALQ